MCEPLVPILEVLSQFWALSIGVKQGAGVARPPKARMGQLKVHRSRAAAPAFTSAEVNSVAGVGVQLRVK